MKLKYNDGRDAWCDEETGLCGENGPGTPPELGSPYHPFTNPRNTTLTNNIVMGYRVASRFIAKGGTGVSLLPEFKKAYEALEKGDPKPLNEFGLKVQGIMAHGGNSGEKVKPVEWVWALGTAKRNAINALFKSITIVRNDTTPLHPGLLPSVMREVATWPKALRTLEIASTAADEGLEIKHGPFTVVPVPGITKGQTDQILAALDQAAAKLRSVFPQVLYGKVYISTHLKSGVGAWYLATEDKFYIDIKVTGTKDFEIYAIIHELGHRFDHKFLKPDLRKRFVDLSTRKIYEKLNYDAKLREQVADEVVAVIKAKVLGKPIPLMSDVAVLWLKTEYVSDPRKLTGDFVAGKIDEKELHAGIKGTKDAEVMTGKVLHGPLAVSAYGSKSTKENFAEGFAHYVLGKPLAPEFVAIFDEAK